MRRRNAGSDDASIRALERLARRTESPVDAMEWGHSLRRVGRIPEYDAELLDRMGAEAWRAWLLGGEFEWRPGEDEDPGEDYADPVDGGQFDEPPNEEDPVDWRRMTALTGLAVRRHADGSPMIVRTYWTVDDAKNFDSTGEDAWPIGTPHADLAYARRLNEIAQSWLSYFTWVGERGRDPLNELRLRHSRASREWVVELARHARRTDQPLFQRWLRTLEDVNRLEALARRCARCDVEIVQEPEGAWVDSTGGDACSNARAPSGQHEPRRESEDDDTPCDDFCGEHARGCDGYCDHMEHMNQCLGERRRAAILRARGGRSRA